MKKNIAALFLAALFCRADCTEWDHPLWLGRGDVWRARFPVVISNPSDKPLAGAPVTVIVGGGPGQAPLAGARAEAVRVTDARGVQLLYALRDPASREIITAGAVPDGAELVLPAVCAPATSVTYRVYFDNPGAWALADFFTETPAGDINGGFETGKRLPVTETRAGAVERLRLRDVGVEADWPAHMLGNAGLLGRLLPFTRTGKREWLYRFPVRVVNTRGQSATNLLACINVNSVKRDIAAPRFLLTFKGRPVETCRLADWLLFECDPQPLSSITYYLYVAEASTEPEPARLAASAPGSDIPSDQILLEQTQKSDLEAFAKLLRGPVNLIRNPDFKYGAEAYEFWGVSWFTYDPWRFGWHSYIHQSSTPGESYYVRYPNGDGYLLYPGLPVGVDGPVTSVRLEAARDGVEDHAYLTLLKSRADSGVDPEAAELLREFAALLDIPNAGGRHSTKILPDPSRLAALRMRAGAALQRRARATSKVPQ